MQTVLANAQDVAADRREKTQILMALAQHFPKSSRSPEEQAIWLRDYLADLDQFPADEVEAACSAWRRTDAAKFPKIGELLIRLRQFSPSKEETARRWEPVQDAVYDAMSLTEKIRYHRIAANEAKCRAGPQWLKRAPALPSDMPKKWHEGRAVAKNHENEASRLDQIMREAMDKNPAPVFG